MSILEDYFNKNIIFFDGFDKMNEALYVHDTEKKYVYMNKAAERLEGYKLEDVKGKTAFDINHKGLTEENSPVLRALTTEKPVVNEIFTYLSIDGRKITQICNASPIYQEGMLIGAYTIQKDVTSFHDIVEKNIDLQNALSGRKNNSGADNRENSIKKMIGSSRIFQTCKKNAAAAAKTDSSVMIIGDTGTGKEGFARAIHENSKRKNKPFIAINCGAIPEGLTESILFGTTKGAYTGAVERRGIFSQANGGTIFLDEINSMPIHSQAKLLRAIEERTITKLGDYKEEKINARIICSMNESPLRAIEEKRLREDLFYRLSVVQLLLPPLKDRKEDIPELVAHFLKSYNQHYERNILGITKEVLEFFMNFSWPGNVRQLKSTIESSVNFVEDNQYIQTENLPGYLFDISCTPESNPKYFFMSNNNNTLPEKTNSSKEISSGTEKDLLIKLLEKNKGNQSATARELGISKQLMYYRMKKYGIPKVKK